MDASKTSENVQKWLDALRSGEFRQGNGHLREGDEFCCLGVACEVYRRETGKGRWDDFPERFWVDNTSSSIDLPPSVQEWLGLTTRDAHIGSTHGPQSWLTGRNDSGVSFEAIADLIESDPAGLFKAAEVEA